MAQTELLQGQLEQLKVEQAILLRAELAAARAAWTRDKEQEMASLLAPWREQEQQRLGQALQRAAEGWELQKKELLERCDARLQQALGEGEERCRGQLAEEQQAQRRQAREGFLAELEACLAELRKQPHGGVVKQGEDESGGAGGSGPPDTVAYIVTSSCRDLMAKAVGQAKKEWTKVGLWVQRWGRRPSVTSVNNFTRRVSVACIPKVRVLPGLPCVKGSRVK